MELIEAGHILWKRRLLVALAFLLACVLFILISFQVSLGVPPKLQSREHFVGAATAQVLIDTPHSQIVAIGSATQTPALYARASLLADLMGSTVVRHEIEAQTGIPADDLGVVPPTGSIVGPPKATALGLAGTAVSHSGSKWKLIVTLDPLLPIIAFDASAPTAQDAQKLASTSVTVLRQLLDQTADADGVKTSQRTVVNVINPPTSGLSARGPRKIMAFGIAVVVLLLLCLAIVLRDGFARRRPITEDELPHERLPRLAPPDYVLLPPPPLQRLHASSAERKERRERKEQVR